MVTLVSQLLQFYSREKNAFQFSMSLYLYSCGCPKRVITVLNQAGISVSYNTILNSLKQSADEKLEYTRKFIKSIPEERAMAYMIHDNVNFPNRVGQHTLTDRDRFISATSGSLGVLQREYKISSTDLKNGKATNLNETDFCNDKLSEH